MGVVVWWDRNASTLEKIPGREEKWEFIVDHLTLRKNRKPG